MRERRETEYAFNVMENGESVIIGTALEDEEPDMEEEKFIRKRKRKRKRKDMKSKKSGYLLVTERWKCSGQSRKESEKASMDSLPCCGSGGGPGEAKGGGGGTYSDNGQPKKWAIWVHRDEFCFNTFPHLATQ